ncbi:2-polyprenylphenol 6-hydroxylase [soil metagenome]
MVSVLGAVRDLGRLREITAVLVRHGFGEIVTRIGIGRRKKESSTGQSEAPPSGAGGEVEIAEGALALGNEAKEKVSTPVRIRLVAQELGPSFIKLGQIASTRPDLIPADIITELKKLQDDVPPVPFEEIKEQIEKSLGASLSETFLTFDEKPLATASIGQVHRATLRTDLGDEEVVVKVQRPGVGQTVARDLELLHMLAAALERTVPETKIYSPIGLVQQFDRSITSELNFLVEAENTERFGKNFSGHPHVRFPKVHRKASSKHVLTQEFFPGLKVTKAVEAGADGKKIAKQSVGVIIKMIFEDGFFHADPHPGNIIILGENDAPIVGLIDAGMVGRLNPELRDRTIDLMVAAARNDPYAVADALYAIGRPTRKIEMREYRAEVALLAEKYLGRPLRELDLSGMIRDLVQGAMKYGLEIPPDFMLVGKSIMTIEGIGKQLDPDLDVFGEAAPHFTELLKQRYSPERLGMELWRGFEQVSRAGYDLPMQLREVLDDLRLGRLMLRTGDPKMHGILDRASRRVFSGAVIGMLFISGAVLLHGGRDPWGITMVSLGGAGLVIHWLGDLVRARRK